MKPYIVLINYTEVENYAYDNETELILKIGSFLIEDIKNGHLLNICLYNRPPSLKGKTYKDIYGDNYKEQIKNQIEEKQKAGF